MISEINFKNIEESPKFAYAKKLDFFKNHEKLTFTPGLNIIYAPNGTGKSTLLKIMGLFTASEQGGVSTYTHAWSYDIEGFKENKVKGISVAHDGQAVLYNNPRESIGLIGGSFDDDFFDEGLFNTMNKESTGLTTLSRLAQIIETLMGKQDFPDKIKSKVKMSDSLKEIIKPTIEPGNRTILMDEPESGLAIHVQEKLWPIIAQGAKNNNFQVIVATHSPYCLGLDANFIELTPNYVNVAKNSIKMLAATI